MDSRNKIIVKIKGGMGNQMFQYAIGLSLYKKTGRNVVYDTSFYHQKHLIETGWPYALSHFRCNPVILEQKGIKHIYLHLLGKITRIFPNICSTYIRDSTIDKLESIINKKRDIYLDGYWQNEKYFKKYEPEIKNKFIVTDNIDETNQYWINTINNTNSVCLHVRRGDYVSNPLANKFHGTCSLEYYNSAVNYMNSHLSNPVYYVFSDDMKWVKENIPIDGQVCYMDHNDSSKNYDDLRLMYSCKHFIIANSSFSWWGAWLSQNPDKIVIAPKRWNNDAVQPDIVPERWMRL